MPGNSASLWKAVNLAKDLGIDGIPDQMHINGIRIGDGLVPDCFAEFFCDKVKLLSDQAQVSGAVYIGRKKVNGNEKMFMSLDDIIECVKSIKIKNCEGYDRIPQRILVDGIGYLALPLAHLFNEIYYTNVIPDQWLISKVCPIFKKGNKNDIISCFIITIAFVN